MIDKSLIPPTHPPPNPQIKIKSQPAFPSGYTVWNTSQTQNKINPFFCWPVVNPPGTDCLKTINIIMTTKTHTICEEHSSSSESAPLTSPTPHALRSTQCYRARSSSFPGAGVEQGTCLPKLLSMVPLCSASGSGTSYDAEQEI